jgi:hypothetical protein
MMVLLRVPSSCSFLITVVRSLGSRSLITSHSLNQVLSRLNVVKRLFLRWVHHLLAQLGAATSRLWAISLCLRIQVTACVVESTKCLNLDFGNVSACELTSPPIR